MSTMQAPHFFKLKENFMKKLIIVILVFIAQTASADTLLKFKDGSANVWDNIYVKGDDYCTKKAYGTELCASKKDVVLKKEVPAGTDPMEAGNAAYTEKTKSDSLWAAEYDEESVNAQKSRNAADDAKAKRNRALQDSKYGKDKAERLRRAEGANSAGH